MNRFEYHLFYGYVDLALTYAEELYDLERSYLLYRLSIIGLGNVKAVNDFISTEIKKDSILERGGESPRPEGRGFNSMISKLV